MAKLKKLLKLQQKIISFNLIYLINILDPLKNVMILVIIYIFSIYVSKKIHNFSTT